MNPRPRSRFRRILRWVLIVITALAALLVIAWSVLHTDWARDKVRGIVQEQLQKRINGTVKIGRLEGDMLGDFTLHDIVILDEHGQPAIKIGTLHLEYKLTPLLDQHFHATRLDVDKLEIAARRGPDGKPILADLMKPQPDTGGDPWTATLENLRVRGAVDFEQMGGVVDRFSNVAIDGALRVRPEATELDVQGIRAHWVNRRIDLGVSGVFDMAPEGGFGGRELTIVAGASTVHIPYLHRDKNGAFASFEASVTAADVRTLAPAARLDANALLAGFVNQPGPDAPVRLSLFGGVGGASIALVADAAIPPAELSGSLAAFWSGAEPHLIWGGAPAGRLTGWTTGRFAGTDLATATARLDLGGAGTIDRFAVERLRLGAGLAAGRLTADVDVASPLGEVKADAVVRLPEDLAEPDQMTIESAHASGLIKDIAKVERALGRTPSASGPVAFQGNAKGRPRDLAVELHAQTPRISRGDLHLLSLEVDVDVAHLPGAPEGTVVVRAADLVKGRQSQGSAHVSARLRDRGRRATAEFSAGGRDGFAARGTAHVENYLAGAPRIELPILEIDTRGLTWKGSAKLAIGRGARTLGGEVDLASSAGTVAARASLTRGATLRGPVELDADVDLAQLAAAFGSGDQKKVVGTAVVKARATLPAGPGTIEADVDVASLYGVEKASASLRASLARRRLDATIEAEVDGIGAVEASVRADTPRDLTDARAWRRMKAGAIESVTADTGKIDLVALAELLGEDRLKAGTAVVHLEAGRGLTTGKLTVELTGADIEPRPDLRLRFGATASAELAADEIRLALRADAQRRGSVELDARLDRLARPFDPAAWRAVGTRAIRDIELRASRIDLSQFEAVADQKAKRGAKATIAAKKEAMRKPRIDLAGHVDLELSVGPRAEMIAVRVGLHRIRARRFAIPLSGELRLVSTRGETGADLRLETGGAAIVTGRITTPIGTDTLLVMRDPAVLRQRLESTPLRADFDIPQQSIARLASLAGKWQVSGTIAGFVQVRGTAVAPTVRAQIRAPGLTAEGVRFDSLQIDGRYSPKGLFVGARADQSDGGRLRAELRTGNEVKGGKDKLLVVVGIQKLRLSFLAPLWRKPGGGLTHLDGRLSAGITAGGTVDRPDVNGWIRLREGEARVPNALRPLHDLAVTIKINKSVANLALFARSRPGTVKVTGSYDMRQPAASSFALAMRARDLPILAGTQLLSLDGNIRAKGRLKNRLWEINTTIDRGVVVRLPDGRSEALHETSPLEDVEFIDPAGLAASEGRRKAKETTDAIGFRIKVKTDDRIIVRGDIIRTDLRVDVQVTSIKGKTAIHGQVDAVRGWVEIIGRRYDIQRARVIFAGEMPTDPRLDVRVAHRFPQTTLYIDVVGHLSQPTVTFGSDSGQYDQAQLLAMVLGGEPGEGQGGDTSHKAAGAAAALMAGQMTSAIRKSGLPIDALKVGTEAGDDQPVTYVTVGKWVSDRLFIAYRRRFDAEVTENANEGVFQHYFAKDWMWEGTAGDRGSASLDLLWVVPF
jgi:autotransporter translocation and assembly factor TamB